MKASFTQKVSLCAKPRRRANGQHNRTLAILLVNPPVTAGQLHRDFTHKGKMLEFDRDNVSIYNELFRWNTIC